MDETRRQDIPSLSDLFRSALGSDLTFPSFGLEPDFGDPAPPPDPRDAAAPPPLPESIDEPPVLAVPEERAWPAAAGDGAGSLPMPAAEAQPASIEPPAPADRPETSRWLPAGDGLQAPEPEVIYDVSTTPDLSPIRDRVAIMLLFHEVIRPEQLSKAWTRWNQRVRRPADTFWRFLAQERGVDRERVYEVAADVYAFPKAEVNVNEALTFIRDRGGVFSEESWRKLRNLFLVPVGQVGEGEGERIRWIFATHDPSRPEVVRAIREVGVEGYELRYAARTVLDPLLAQTRRLRNSYLDRVVRDEHVEQLPTELQPTNTYVDEAAVTAQIAQSSLVNLFEAMLIEAVRWGASDIHIIPAGERRTEIHFRVDGDLVCWRDQDRLPPEAFFAVLKDNASNVDRFERDAAQDGFLQRTVDEATIRYRVSVVPISTPSANTRSESVVIRVLDDRRTIDDLSRIVGWPEDRDRFDWAMQQPQGMVILTGPTGSGKSTTLVAALQHVASPKLNTITIEDPVEYVIPGVRQLRINQKFEVEEAIRYILRHDPDVVMVGEMRDFETADLAIKLANTGHLTFSTLHANDATSVVSRLFKMGVEPFLIAHAINLVVAQRLIRLLCPVCKRTDEQKDDLLLARLGVPAEEIPGLKVYRPGGNATCEKCHGTGFHGRKAVLETLVFSPEVRQIIASAGAAVDETRLRTQAMDEGMRPLREAACELVRDGLTAPRELLRAVPTEYRPRARA